MMVVVGPFRLLLFLFGGSPFFLAWLLPPPRPSYFSFFSFFYASAPTPHNTTHTLLPSNENTKMSAPPSSCSTPTHGTQKKRPPLKIGRISPFLPPLTHAPPPVPHSTSINTSPPHPSVPLSLSHPSQKRLGRRDLVLGQLDRRVGLPRHRQHALPRAADRVHDPGGGGDDQRDGEVD
jgi:hypothetical protein